MPPVFQCVSVGVRNTGVSVGEASSKDDDGM